MKGFNNNNFYADGSLNGASVAATGAISGDSLSVTNAVGGGSASFTNACGCGQLNADNVRLDGNTISITDANGNMNIKANGTGGIVLTTPADAQALVIDSPGTIRTPLQSSFQARLESDSTNVTGDGTDYTVTGWTEIQDRNADFNPTTGVFTAPSAGFYLFNATLFLEDIASAHTVGVMGMVINSVYYRMLQFHPYNLAANGGSLCINGTSFVYLSNSHTASLYISIQNGTKIVDLKGSNSDYYTYFTGTLIG